MSLIWLAFGLISTMHSLPKPLRLVKTIVKTSLPIAVKPYRAGQTQLLQTSLFNNLNAQAFSMSSNSSSHEAQEVINYWFGDQASPSSSKYAFDKSCQKKWFMGGAAVDKEITEKFGPVLERLATDELDGWKQDPISALAGVIVMDQFSRNIHRGTPKAFAMDSKCLGWASHILDTGMCKDFPLAHQLFLVLPLEHTEDLAIQERCVLLSEDMMKEAEQAAASGNEDAVGSVAFFRDIYQYAIRHRDVIAKWGRFPHRNAVLGRESTPEEQQGLADGTIAKFG